jgi:hypothetical protein
MDAKEVANNKTSDIRELRQLNMEWTALLWLQRIIKKAQAHNCKLLQA